MSFPLNTPDRKPFPEALRSEDALTYSLAARITALLTPPTGPLPLSTAPSSVFFSISLPDIPVCSYVRRLVRYAQCSPAAFPAALVLLSRLAAADPSLTLNTYNLHRLVLTSLMLAAKALDDRCYSNAHYARVGGISSVAEINRLELTLLHILNFNVYISNADYSHAEGILLALLPRPSPPPLRRARPATVLSPPGSPLSASPGSSPGETRASPRPLVRVATDGGALRAAAARVMAARNAEVGRTCSLRVGKHSQSWHGNQVTTIP